MLGADIIGSLLPRLRNESHRHRTLLVEPYAKRQRRCRNRRRPTQSRSRQQYPLVRSQTREDRRSSWTARRYGNLPAVSTSRRRARQAPGPACRRGARSRRRRTTACGAAESNAPGARGLGPAARERPPSPEPVEEPPDVVDQEISGVVGGPMAPAVEL
jgi:hypothetical protein